MRRSYRRSRWPLLILSAAILGLVFWFALPHFLPQGGVVIGPGEAEEPGVDAPEAAALPPPPGPPIIAPSALAPLPAPRPSSATRPIAAADSVPQPQPGARLLIPVAGVRPDDLADTYTQSRSEGRSHNAIDIAAPRGTPVLAAADGRVMKLFQSEQGGTTLYQLDPDGRTIYYYAHLDGYAPGIAEGMMLSRGDTLGYVGDTGNSGAGNYHLHFGVSLTDDPEQFWGGEDVNPYPLLRGPS